MTTFEDAQQAVRDALDMEASRYDVPGATEALRAEFGTYDFHEAVYGTSDRFASVPAADEAAVSAREARFWGVVERFRLPA